MTHDPKLLRACYGPSTENVARASEHYHGGPVARLLDRFYHWLVGMSVDEFRRFRNRFLLWGLAVAGAVNLSAFICGFVSGLFN